MKFHKSIYSLCCIYVITVCICRGLLKCWQIWHVKCFCTFPLKGKGAPPSCPLSLSLLILLTLTALLPWLLILFCVVSLLDLSLSLEIWLVFRAGWKRIQAYNLIWVLTSNQKKKREETAIKTINSDKRNKLKGRGRDREREKEKRMKRGPKAVTMSTRDWQLSSVVHTVPLYVSLSVPLSTVSTVASNKNVAYNWALRFVRRTGDVTNWMKTGRKDDGVSGSAEAQTDVGSLHVQKGSEGSGQRGRGAGGGEG